MEKKGSKSGKILKIGGVLLAIAAVVVLCIVLFPYIKKLQESEWLTNIQVKLIEFFDDTGVVMNILVLTVLQIAQMLFAPIPGGPISFFMGVAFGPIWGTVLNIISTVMGTILIVWCVEKFGMKFVNKFMNSKGFEKLTFLHTPAKRNMLLFLLFLIPGTPKDMVTFVAPFAGAKPKTIVLASLARIPSIILMVVVGDSFSSNQLPLMAAVLAIAAMAGLAGILLRDKLFPSKIERNLRLKNTVIFDLDGTLLNTLGDLTDAANYALQEYGYPERTEEEIRSFVGNGIRKLIERALPEDADESAAEKVLEKFKEYYEAHMTDRTVPYDGIPELLARLGEAGYRLAIVSNKADFAVQSLREHFFSESIPLAIGESAGIQRKPAPDSLLTAMKRLGATPEETIYVGDSGVDVETARNAGVDCISVTWGFSSVGALLSKGAETTVKKPEEIGEMLIGDRGSAPNPG